MKHVAQQHAESQASSATKRSADQVAAVADNVAPEKEGNKPNTEMFTKGRFDSSETLAQQTHHKHAKHPHQHLAQPKDKDPVQEEKEMEEVYAKEEAAAAEAARVKALVEHEAKMKAEYEARLAAADQYDGTVHMPNG